MGQNSNDLYVVSKKRKSKRIRPIQFNAGTHCKYSCYGNVVIRLCDGRCM